jgi:hypothetical protein
MTKKIIIALSAILIGSASGALAYEDPENKLGDRYPLLEPGYRSVMPSMSRQFASRNPFGNDDLENKIGDRYPRLEPGYRPNLALTPRQVAGRDRMEIEDPESRIADKYPLLEHRFLAQRQLTRRIIIRTVAETRSVATNGNITKNTAKRERRL